jgi:hypothetical protein
MQDLGNGDDASEVEFKWKTRARIEVRGRGCHQSPKGFRGMA